MNNISPNYAPFWKKACAFIIDAVILLILELALVVYIFTRLNDYLGSNGILLYGTVIIAFIAYMFFLFLSEIYFAIMWKSLGASFGQLIFKIKVVDSETLGRLTSSQIKMRRKGYAVCVVLLGLGFYLSLLDKKHQGLHDKMASTIVIND